MAGRRFRKRFSAEDIARINEEIYRRQHPSEDPPEDGGNKGKLILDATVAPSDVRYPTDLSLLNECRENTEKMIEHIWDKTERKGHKTAYSRKNARKKYLKIAKQRKPRKKQIKQAVKEQLDYVERNLNTLETLLSAAGAEALSDRRRERLLVIREVARQQKEHLAEPKMSVPSRIVNLRQPHVRPIVRGKAGVEVEFGQKLAFSVVNGYTFVEKQGWNNFAEGLTLKDSVEKYRQRHGFYPEAILADKTYRNRENLKFCKEHGIRLSGPRLGRPKLSEIEADREQAYIDSCERNMVEGRNGISKRRFGLDLIMARLPETGETEAAMNVLCMNVAHLLRVLLRFFYRFFCRLLSDAYFDIPLKI